MQRPGRVDSGTTASLVVDREELTPRKAIIWQISWYGSFKGDSGTVEGATELIYSRPRLEKSDRDRGLIIMKAKMEQDAVLMFSGRELPCAAILYFESVQRGKRMIEVCRDIQFFDGVAPVMIDIPAFGGKLTAK